MPRAAWGICDLAPGHNRRLSGRFNDVTARGAGVRGTARHSNVASKNIPRRFSTVF